MTDRILVVTPPDDTLLQGIRITHVALTEEQTSMVSASLMKSETPYSIINYVWNVGNSVEWLFDKLLKSDLVIFDAENESIEMLIGWIASKPNSYYFGTLRDLHLVNDRVIYSIDDILILLEKLSKKHG